MGQSKPIRATALIVEDDPALLRYLGCTGHAHEVATVFGDEISIRAQPLVHDAGTPAEVMRDVLAFATAGHDPAELYRVRLPKAGSVIELLDVIPMNIRGQGVAWDRANPGTIAGIVRATKAEREAGGRHKVTIFRFTP